MCIVERRSEMACWDAGISTRYASKLTTRDIKQFVEEVLGVKCWKVHFVIDEGERGIKFYIKNLNFFEKCKALLKKCDYSETENVFVAYDFKFFFEGERLISNEDTQAWINFMIKKFGKEYEKFMFVFTEQL